MPIYRTIIFDYFGVIANDPNLIFIARHHLDAAAVSQLVAFCQKADRGEYGEVLEFFSDVGGLVDMTGEEAWAELEGAHEFNTELLELIRQLRQNGLKVGLLSNTDTSLHGFLKEHGVHDLFDVVLTSGEMAGITAPKPDPAFLLYAVEKLNATPRQVVFFDDKPSNIDGAKQAGIEAAFVFTTVEQCQADLKSVSIQL